MSFPILVDIYAEPIISQVMNVYPVSSPTISIPRVRMKTDIIGYDGELESSYVMPTPHHLVRAGFLTAEAGPGISNLFDLTGVSSQGLIMNRRYTLVEGIKINAKASDGTVTEIEVETMFRPNARDVVSGDSSTVEFVGPKGTPDEGKLMSCNLMISFNYDTGNITNSAVMTVPDDAELTYEYAGAKISLKFTAKNSDKGRCTVHVEQEMTDLTIDPKFFVWIIK